MQQKEKKEGKAKATFFIWDNSNTSNVKKNMEMFDLWTKIIFKSDIRIICTALVSAPKSSITERMAFQYFAVERTNMPKTNRIW